MRWLPRWRRRTTHETRQPVPVVPPRAAHWRRLPPLAPTVRQPPLTAAASMGVVAGEATRPLIHTPGRTRPAAGAPAPSRAGAADSVEPTVGRVTGLVAVRAEAPPEQHPPEQLEPAPRRARAQGRTSALDHAPAPVAPPTGPRLTPRVLASAGHRPNLVEAADEYVGQPAPDPTPQASSAWLRMVESYRQARPTDGDPSGVLPPLPEDGAPWSSEAAIEPPRPAREPRTEAARPARRASLAESRRLGLGDPLRRPTATAPQSAADEPDSRDVPGVLDEQLPDDSAAPPPVPGAGTEADESAPVRPAPETPPGTRGSATAAEAPPVPRRTPRSTPATPATAESPTAVLGQDRAVRTAERPAATSVHPVYRFVPGERPTPATAKAVRPLPAAPAPIPAASASTASARTSTRSDRPLTHPPAPGRPDRAPTDAEPRPPAPAPPPVEAPPADLAEAVRRIYGVDVSDVPIHRGPESAAEARELGARAFTRGGEVFLPADEGSFDQPVARGLLAHELTHAAQQRALGPALPTEDSEAGAALESAALGAERWARGMDSAPAPNGAIPSASWTAPWHSASPGGVQRQAGDVATATAPPPPPALTAAPANGTPPATENPEPAATGPTVTGDAPRAAANSPARPGTEAVATEDRPTGRRPLDLDDSGDIEELAVRVYQKIHGRLRRELLVDRERAGRLSETGPFGWAR